MKISRIEDKFVDETGREVNWREIAEITGLGRGDSRLLLKKLAMSGKDIPPGALLRWRDDQVLMWKLENELCVA